MRNWDLLEGRPTGRPFQHEETKKAALSSKGEGEQGLTHPPNQSSSEKERALAVGANQPGKQGRERWALPHPDTRRLASRKDSGTVLPLGMEGS
jgi:hypothetical protein